jgi:hypothetical protein
MSRVPQELGQAFFDPTREDSSTALAAYQSEPEIVFNDMSGVEMTPSQIRSVINADFAECALPAEAIQALINSSRQVQNSLRNITKEHVSIGGHLANIANVFVNSSTEQYGDNQAVRQRALELLYKYIERVHGMRRRSARNYIKAYRLIQDNPIAQACLSHSDAEFLSRKNLPQQVINAVVNAKATARAAGETMPFKDVKALTEELMTSRTLLTEAIVTNEDLQEKLADTTDLLSNEQIANKHLIEANTKLASEIRTMQDLVAHTTEDMGRQVAHVNALRTDNENLLAEKARVESQLADALANPKIEYRDPETPPESVETATLRKELRAIEAAIDEKRQDLEAATGMLKKASELGEEKQKRNLIDDKVTELVDQLGTFHATYSTTQLLIAGGGYLKEYRPSLEALADKMRQFLTEIEAAVKHANA